MRTIAEKIVDDLLEGRIGDWFADRWQDVKSVTGLGHDSFGLGTNTEKGWKPKYGPRGPVARKKPQWTPPPEPQPGEKTWNIDS